MGIQLLHHYDYLLHQFRLTECDGQPCYVPSMFQRTEPVDPAVYTGTFKSSFTTLNSSRKHRLKLTCTPNTVECRTRSNRTPFPVPPLSETAINLPKRASLKFIPMWLREMLHCIALLRLAPHHHAVKPCFGEISCWSIPLDVRCKEDRDRSPDTHKLSFRTWTI